MTLNQTISKGQSILDFMIYQSQLVYDKTKELNPDMIVFPEYSFGRDLLKSSDLENLINLYVEPHPTLVLGTGVHQAKDKYRNTAIVLSKSNEIHLIQKSHLMSHERDKGLIAKDWNNLSQNIVEFSNGLKAGIVICADLWNSEFIGMLVAKGIDILLVPTMSVTLDNHDMYARYQWYSLALVRSREFVIPIVVSDQLSRPRVTTGFASCIVDPSVKNSKIKSLEDFLILPDKAGVAYGEIDLSKINEYRKYRQNEGLYKERLD